MKNRVILPQVSRNVLGKLACLTRNIGYIVQVSLIKTKFGFDSESYHCQVQIMEIYAQFLPELTRKV